MALYMDEEDVWKCRKHPSKKRRTGICHICLREKLLSLCPDCANLKPCSCRITASSSSSSSSFRVENEYSDIGTVGRISNLIDSEPSFRRSKSVAVPFLKSNRDGNSWINNSSSSSSPSSSWIWSRFKRGNKSRRNGEESIMAAHIEAQEEEENGFHINNNKNEEKMKRMMMRKSKSVAAKSDSGFAELKSSKSKRWYFYFPSPIKAFKQSIS